MVLVTSEEMQKIDKHAIELIGIPSLVLMEKAGSKVFKVIKQRFKGCKDKEFTVVCGKGNNGGDGLVVARHLIFNNIKTHIFTTSSHEQLSTDARTNYNILKNLGVTIKSLTSNDAKIEFENTIKHSNFIIDAIFGTGFSGEAKDDIKKVIDAINNTKSKKIAIDIPSGACATTGFVSQSTVKADITVTLGLPKVGLFLLPAHKFVGEVWIADIGIPDMSKNSIKANYFLIDSNLVKCLMPKRSDYDHKGNFGNLLILAGSKEYQGAGVLSSIGGLKSGVGKVTLGLPHFLYENLKISLPPELIIKPFSDKNGYFYISDEEITHISNYSAILLGPGWGRNEVLLTSLQKVLNCVDKPLLIDADGIYVLSNLIQQKNSNNISNKNKLVLTPHLGEFLQLVGKNKDEVHNSFDVINEGKEFVKKHNCTLVIKSAISFIITPDLNTYILCNPNSALAKGGAGDLLAGIIAGYMSQGLTVENASILGVYIHSLAAKLATKKNSPHTLTISEISQYINRCYNIIKNKKTSKFYNVYNLI